MMKIPERGTWLVTALFVALAIARVAFDIGMPYPVWAASVSVTLNATITSVSLPNGNYQFVANGLSPDSGFVPANPIIGVFGNDSTNANQTWTWNGTTLAAVGTPAGTYMKDTGSGIGLVAAGSADTWQIHKVGSTSTYTIFDVTTGRYLGMNGSTSGAPGSLVEGALQTAWIANPIGARSDLAVASNGHYLNKSGVPFFFLGDTEWILNMRSDSDVTAILNDRATKGFSVVQVMAVRSWNFGGSGDVSHDANGNLPFIGSDPTQLNAPYWARWHSIASQTATKGLYFLLVYGEPGTGGSNWNCTTGAQCYEYGRQVGITFRDLSNVIFCNGQDSHASSNTALYRAMAEGVADGVNGVNSFNGSADYSTTMMTYHGQDDQISTLHQDLWLDFYGVEVFGSIASLYSEVNSMYNLVSPTKPGMILEGDYETYTYPDGFATPYRERLQVWNVAFAGGAYSYGHNSNYLPSQAPSTYLNSVGAQGMQVFSTFMRARPWWNLVPHQAAILSGTGSGETQKDAVQSVDGSECLVYYPSVQAVTIDMSCITSSSTVSASWFDPRNGNTQTIGSFANSGSQALTPPGGWEDAVLVLDGGPTTPAPAAAAGFTTLVIDYDFTQTSPWSNPNSWLKCNNGTGSTTPLLYQGWVGFGGFNWPPCSNIAQRTDPLGSLALNLHMDKATINAMGCEPNCNMLYESLQTVSSGGTGNVLPSNLYAEATILTRTSDSSMNSLVLDAWSYDISGAGIEWDGIEWFRDNRGHTTYHNNASSNVFSTNANENLDQSSYHKVAWRVTSNGSNDGFFCSYLDDAPVASSPGNCISWSPTSSQASSAIPVTVAFLMGFTACGGVDLSGACPNSSVDMWVKRLRVWSCAGINSGASCFSSSANP